MRKVSIAAALACAFAASLISTGANALSCPSASDFATSAITAQYTLSGASSCAYGTGHYNHSAADDPVLTGTVGSWPGGLPSTFLEKINQDLSTVGDASIASLSFGTPSSDGTVTILQDLTNVFVALVGGQNANPTWAIFDIGNVTANTVLSWSIVQKNPQGKIVPLNLSHVLVFGEAACLNCAPPPAVPLPPAAVLFVSGLAGVGLIGRRRRKQAAA